jgi:hypothetical protein
MTDFKIRIPRSQRALAEKVLHAYMIPYEEMERVETNTQTFARLPLSSVGVQLEPHQTLDEFLDLCQKLS